MNKCQEQIFAKSERVKHKVNEEMKNEKEKRCRESEICVTCDVTVKHVYISFYHSLTGVN